MRASISLEALAPVAALGELEARLGVRLLNRTTRRLSLTDEGEVFHARCLDLLKGVDEAEAEITSRSVDVSGGLRINAPVTFGISHLSSVWSEFRALYPKVSLDITLADRVVDLVEEGYDLAIRIARLPNSSLISRKLATTRMVLCASPTYLARAGTLAHPSDLAEHAVLAYSLLVRARRMGIRGPSRPRQRQDRSLHPHQQRRHLPASARCATGA